MSALHALRLIAITDRERWGEATLLERWASLARAAAPGSVAIDLRERSLSARAQLALGQRLAEVAARFGQLLIVNDRLDLAHALAADGVHLGEMGVETQRARSLLPGVFVVRACHQPARVAELDADIVLLSPILAARKGNPALGVAGLEAAAARIREASPMASGRADGVAGLEAAAARVQGAPGAARLFALGGVDAAGAALCLAAGARGIAAIAGVFASDDPLPLVRALGIER